MSTPPAAHGRFTRFRRTIQRAYLRLVIDGRYFTLATLILLTIAAAVVARGLRFDASSETLVATHDATYDYYRVVTSRFGSDEFLLLTFEPTRHPLASRESLLLLANLQTRLQALPDVRQTVSLLDVPLLRGANIGGRLAEPLPTLREPGIAIAPAFAELRQNAFIERQLLSDDHRSTAIRIDLTRSDSTAVTELARRIRELAKTYAADARIYVGGVPLIAADMIAYVRRDVAVFGGVVVLVLAVTLFAFFRQIRWVLLPLLCGLTSVTVTAAALVLADRPVTVVSANFVPLVFILSVSLGIHLTVRYRELVWGRSTSEHPSQQVHHQLIGETMVSKWSPSVYTTLTTCIAFGSLLVSQLQPIIDFGWMVSIGVVIALATSYLLFPAALACLRAEPPTPPQGLMVVRWVGRWVHHHAAGLSALACLAAAFAATGIQIIELENRFIDYFRADTDVRKSLTYLDEHYGGTLPFDVIVSVAPPEAIDPDDPFFDESVAANADAYWHTVPTLTALESLSNFIRSRANVGVATSAGTLWAVARAVNGQPLSQVELTAVLVAMPPAMRAEYLAPFAHAASGTLRITGRMTQQGSLADHDAFVEEIVRRAAELGFDPDGVHVSGMMVLFDNMLRELLGSQLRTLAFVILGTLLLFATLLRSAILALVGVLPNIIGAGLVIALMGFLAIPLDIMMVTVAAICVGMGVDDAIHYLHRFKEELHTGSSAADAITAAHDSVGRAMYFTSVAVIAGFSVLVLSPFLPTVRFGLLTGLAMLLTLLANLVVVPSVLLVIDRFYDLRRLGHPANGATRTPLAVTERSNDAD